MASPLTSTPPSKRKDASHAKAVASQSSHNLSNLSQWKLEDAKARFSELVRDANKAPQLVTVRGKEAAVILAPEDYRRLVAQPEQQSLTDFLATLDFSALDLEREPDYGRDIDFLTGAEGSL
jgi:prevent-host-death family protein